MILGGRIVPELIVHVPPRMLLLVYPPWQAMTRIVVVVEMLWPAYAVLEQFGAEPSSVMCIEQPAVGDVKPIDKGRIVGGAEYVPE